MNLNDAKYAKRKLDFQDQPFHFKTFYLDIKAETVKRKVVRRIRELGGTVEGFLSKDVHLVITDKKNGELERKSNKEVKTIQISNLSRGRALLLKANAQSNKRRSSVGGNDITQNALNLGVKVDQASIFLRDSSKFVHAVKKTKKTNELDGITPLEWTESEKENTCCLKIEDTEQLYKPLIKHFETFPSLFYNEEVASPFVKGVVLTKQTDKIVNRYSTAKKTVTSNKGGFCEACDYWYKCSLREHIKSAKHEKFVKDRTNFDHLDTVINKLPSFSDFFVKLNKVPGKESNMDTEMPLLHVCNELSENQNEKDILDCAMPNLSSCIVETIDVLDSEMPSLHKEFPYDHDDTNTQDSGTGRDIQDGEFCDVSKCDITDKHLIKRTNSDSALPPDEEFPIQNVCCTPSLDYHNDNAVFMDEITHKSTNTLTSVQNVTSNVRKKFSKISLFENNQDISETCDSYSSIKDRLYQENSIVSPQKVEKSFCFSEISSPSSKGTGQSNFKDLVTNWIHEIENSAHIPKQDSCDRKTKNDIYSDISSVATDLTEEYNPQDYHTMIRSTTDKSEVTKEGINSLYGNINIVNENSCSRDSISLISMPETPEIKKTTFSGCKFGILDDSYATPDNTLCASDTSVYSMISECTTSNQRSKGPSSQFTPHSEKSLDCENIGSNSKHVHEPLKIKINLSEIKKNEKKAKRKVKVKRRIFPENPKENYDSFYQMHQQGEMKIKLCKVAKTPVQKNGDLMSYWKVRKSGGCRLVFSSEKRKENDIGNKTGDISSKGAVPSSDSEKRKACHLENDHHDHSEKLRKRRKCIYLQFF
ncbi:uncharacterized protein LOC134695178 [Mytilus trossulus]|uniref:uncharacterized protein LOC134695178 n=1 Tax=Mytilus trossulus TaxID=6551 RepID=UPI0030078A78